MRVFANSTSFASLTDNQRPYWENSHKDLESSWLTEICQYNGLETVNEKKGKIKSTDASS